MNKKLYGLLAVCTCASIAIAQGPGGFGRGPGGFGRGPGGPGGRGGFGGERVVTGAPYSAVEVRTFQEKLGDGNLISRTSQTTLYRDALGRTRTEIAIPANATTGKAAYTFIEISDPVAGQRYALDSATMTYHVSRLAVAHGSGRGAHGPTSTTTAGASAHTGPNGAAITTASLGVQIVNNASATGTLITEIIPAGSRMGNAQAITITRETWFSAELKRAVRTKIGDPQRGNSDTELTNLVQGAPSASLFTVPAGYTAAKAEARGSHGGPGASPLFRGGGPR